MKRIIIKTDDGSSSIYLPDLDEHYHSIHGAIIEAFHVFIKNGLDLFEKGSKIDILEIGFGTGLNCFITFLESQKRNLKINYTGIEAFPLKEEEISQLNYVEELDAVDYKKIFAKIHQIEWGKQTKINKDFDLLKKEIFFKEVNDENQFDLIFYDAFGARVQPDLWTEEIFKKMFSALKNNGILVTYSAKGSVRRAMQSVGFLVERLPGPPGKREMLRAKKII